MLDMEGLDGYDQKTPKHYVYHMYTIEAKHQLNLARASVEQFDASTLLFCFRTIASCSFDSPDVLQCSND